MYYIIAGQFARSHGSYNPNLGSGIVILGGDIRSRRWPNIGGTYGTYLGHRDDTLDKTTTTKKVIDLLHKT